MVEHIYNDFNECYWDDLWYFFKKRYSKRT